MPLVVDRVPALSATLPFLASEPAIASVPMMGMKRANSISRPSMTLIQGMLQFMPANAEPLLPPHEVKAYSTSEKP